MISIFFQNIASGIIAISVLIFPHFHQSLSSVCNKYPELTQIEIGSGYSFPQIALGFKTK